MSMACPPGTTAYVIQPGDTFFGLARRFGTTVAAIVSANPFVDPNNLPIGRMLCLPLQPQFPACPERNFYTIQPGDTFFSLARRFNVSLDDLLEANPGVDPDRLFVGQVVCIPLAVPPVRCPVGTLTYTIQPGDTLFSLARRFNTTVVSIIGVNPGINPEALLIGQQICIPREA
ncbi:MAG: LysM peptidoglycan-binding domain-containing protein [Bacteroidota bacterium]